jgi:peptide/nickel transport system ATP-binding protein
VTDTLEIRDLSLSTVDGTELARCDRLTAGKGSIIGVVGPSGSGKTTLLRAMAGALPQVVPSAQGTLRVLDREPLTLSPEDLRSFRRHHIGFVGQDPASRLNPRMRVGAMLAETGGGPDVLAEVGLPATDDLLRRRPSSLSGGQQRRVALARALARRPDLLLLDEPTAGLDAALRAKLSDLLREQADNHGTTIVLACHDLSLIDRLADEVVDLDTSPEPSRTHDTPVVSGPGGPPVLRLSGVSTWAGSRQILHDVDLSLESRGSLGIVGASAAGKTTVARTIVGLHKHSQGTITFDSGPLPLRTERRSRDQRRRIQLVPQDPLGTLNPSRTVGATLTRPLRGTTTKVPDLLETVGLPEDFARRYPHELSGGQRQRVAIARALAANPDVLVCDEVTSSLDSPTADDIMALLSELRSERGLALILITHEIALVSRYTNSIVVLDEGRVVESGETAEVLNSPTHPATAELSQVFVVPPG